MRPQRDGGYETATIGNFPTQPTAIGTDVHGELYVLSDYPGWLSGVRFERVQPVSGGGVANR